MKHTHARAIAAVLAVALWAVACNAQAEGYAGLGIGRTSVDICGDARAIGASSCDDTDTGWSLLGGYDINEIFAVELSYTGFGEVSASAPGVRVTADASAWTLSAKATQAINDALSVFGRLGYAHWKADVAATGGLGANSDGNDLMYGLGAQWDFNDQVGVRGEWDRTDADGDNVDLLSVAVIYSFRGGLTR